MPLWSRAARHPRLHSLHPPHPIDKKGKIMAHDVLSLGQVRIHSGSATREEAMKEAAILDSALSVVRYDGGVDWGGEPVTFVVGIAGKGDEHLEILSQIAILFSDEDEIENLKRAQTAEELFGMVSAAGV